MILLTWLLLWHVAAQRLDLPVLLPGPLLTLQTLLALAQGSVFWQSLGQSLLRIGAGYVGGVMLGIAFACLASLHPTVSAFFAPVRTLIRSTPISSTIILVLLWLDTQRVPLFIAMITTLPAVWQGVQQGIEQVDRDLLEMARAYDFSVRKKLRFLYIPSIMPHFYASAATAMGFAWKAGIAAEVISKPLHAIGSRLQDAKVYLNTGELFAWTLAVVILSLLLEALLRAFLRRHQGGINAGVV